MLYQTIPQYGIAEKVLREAKYNVPNFEPSSLLDFGSGTGSAIWAARELWGSSLKDVMAVEPSKSMRQVSQHLLYDMPGLQFRKSLREVQRLHYGQVRFSEWK